MPFKFDSQHFFLTYPHSGFSHDELRLQIESIAAIDWLRVCTEQHESGEPHVHAVGRFKRRFQTRNERAFDCQGRHPKIEPVRSVSRALEYVSKDGNYTDFGTVPSRSAKRSWDDIVQAAEGPELEWLKVVYEEKVPMHVSRRLRELRQSTDVDLAPYDERPISSALEALPKEFQSMLIIGEPGIGKTGWAMKYMPRPCLLVKHMDTLREYRTNYHQSILFDDMTFTHLPRATQMMLCDYENQVQIHVRYNVAKIPAHVPRVFLCNPDNEPFVQDSAIQGRRLRVFRIHNCFSP